MKSQAHDTMSEITNTRKTQKIPVSPEEIVSPAAAACDDEMPNMAGVACWPAWIMAEGTSAASGTIAPASSSAPCRVGRHTAASAATATTASMTRTLPAITIAGLSNALPAVTVCEVPVVATTSV